MRCYICKKEVEPDDKCAMISVTEYINGFSFHSNTYNVCTDCLYGDTDFNPLIEEIRGSIFERIKHE